MCGMLLATITQCAIIYLHIHYAGYDWGGGVTVVVG